MSYSSPTYRPSILELARAGNFQAIAYWMNSLLAPQGLSVRAKTTKSGCLKLVVDFRYPLPRNACLGLRQQLVKFICYRLWTLNSEAIRDVRIVARIAGQPDIVWRQSVRIITPANRRRVQPRSHVQVLTQRGAAWVRFQVLRSLVVGRIAIAGFFLCYWFLYWELSGLMLAEPSVALLSSVAPDAAANSASPKGGVRLSESPSIGIQGSASINLGVIPEQFQGQIVRQVATNPGEKLVALTFDDGPWENYTEQVLNILRQNNIKATFFWIGLHIQKHPELARKVAAEGHAIGNHTWTHPLNNLDTFTAAQEVGNTAKLIYETTGLHTTLLRPPGGNLNGQLAPYAQQQKDTIVLWSVESSDYYVSAPLIIDNVLSNVHPGGIVLMHDGGGDRSATVQALPQIISALRSQGYTFVTVPELLARQAKQTVAAAN